MQNFSYKARDKEGKAVKGMISAENQTNVVQRLKEMGYLPIEIKEQTSSSLAQKKFSGLLDRFKKVKLSELQMFTKQLAVLQKAGVPFVASLKSLKEQAENKVLSEAISDLVKDVEGGESVSVAMAKHPKIFDNLYINLVKAGEAGGVLTDSLERLSRLQEAEGKMRMRIKSALRYPIMVVCALVIGVILLVMLVVPAFAKIYASMNTKLPLPTQILIGTHYVITKLWWLVSLILGGLFYAFKMVINTKKGRYVFDKFMLKIIIFGPLFLKIIISRFSRTTAILMRSGVPILDVLDLAAASAGNVIVAETIRKIKEDVNKGMGMATPMKASGLFPGVVIQMVSVGEDTGKTDELLTHVADYYDSQVDYTIDNLTALIEPILLLFMGGAVLLVMLGVFMPMWNMASLLTK